MKHRFTALVFVLGTLSAAGVFADTELYIERASSKVNIGFKERVYIDGKNKLSLTDGKSGTVTVTDGPHRIYAELSTAKSDELTFDARGGTVRIVITANSVEDLVISLDGAVAVTPAKSPAPAKAPRTGSPTAQRPVGQSTLEIALYAAGDVIIAKLQPKTTVAVVSIASQDTESAEFVLDELAYIIVNAGSFKVVDRKSLEAITTEQNFQTSGNVSDESAVDIGNMLGANIVITGSISGVGSTRRLRLKALDVATAEIVGMASESF